MRRSRLFFLVLLAALALQRLWELRLSRRNAQRLLATGAREHAASHYGIMKLLHGAWFLSIIAEIFALRRPFHRRLATVASLCFLLGQGLRQAAIHALGPRWTTRVITVPGEEPVATGIYRFLRHPNYLGVILELASVPLIHGAYLTALLFSLANARLLYTRIRAEEAALATDSAYDRFLGNRPRFFPSP